VSFTVNLGTSIGQVRILVGDDQEGKGPLPDGANFSDDQIGFFLSQEDNDPGRAAALTCENLATRYSVLVDIAIGPRRESLSQAAKAFREQAVEMRDKYGGGSEGVISVGLIRVDGYSDDKPADQVEQTGSDYSAGDFKYIRP